MRRLRPIEIAEGALLADIAIVLQLLSLYLPFLSLVFRILTPAIFTVLVFRRGLYVSTMSVIVTIFTTGVMTGFHLVVPITFACGAGIYLGETMRRRSPAPLVILVGATMVSAAVYAVVFGLVFLAGLPISDLITALQRTYTLAISAVDFVAGLLNLSGWWRNDVYPLVDLVVKFAFTYWWALYYVALWSTLLPMVVVVYGLTNSILRLLGYDLPAFPGRFGDRAIARMRRLAIKEGVRRGILKKRAVW